MNTTVLKSKPKFDANSWHDAIELFRQHIPESVRERQFLNDGKKMFLEVVLRDGRSLWVERFSEAQDYPSFMHFVIEVPGETVLSDMLVKRDDILSMQWIPEQLLAPEDQPPFGFSAHVNHTDSE